MKLWEIALSHHYPSHFSSCYRIGGVWVCARCTGFYPSIFVVIIISAVMGLWKVYPWVDVPLLYLTPIPCLVDWSVGFIKNSITPNTTKTLLGAMAGLGVGRAIFLNLRAETRLWAIVQFGGIALFVIVVLISILAGAWRKTHRNLNC